MEIDFQSELQKKIADLMWNTNSLDEIHRIIDIFGNDAQIVYEMMLASHFDDVNDVTQADQILRDLKIY